MKMMTNSSQCDEQSYEQALSSLFREDRPFDRTIRMTNNWGMFSRKLYDLPNFLDLLVESLDNFVGAVRYHFRYHERDKWIHCVMDNFVWCVWIGSKCDKKDCLLSGEPMSKTIMRWMEYRTIFSVGFTVFPLGCTFTKTLVLPITFTTSPS